PAAGAPLLFRAQHRRREAPPHDLRAVHRPDARQLPRRHDPRAVACTEWPPEHRVARNLQVRAPHADHPGPQRGHLSRQLRLRVAVPALRTDAPEWLSESDNSPRSRPFECTSSFEPLERSSETDKTSAITAKSAVE